MLRIIQNTSANGAKSYYSTADYYLEGQELEGRWCGKTASRLGLSGNVAKADWDHLCDNKHPITEKPLTLRTKSDRTVGYDFNFHVPKSVSLLYAMTRDERLLDAFRDAVHGTMQDMESEMQTRVRIDGKNENRTTGNMVWGEFIHFTARPVAGVPDPHLHAHCFVFNTTWDQAEERFKAGQFRDLKRDAPYFEAVFHSRLAYRLEQLGLPIERTTKGWELAGPGKSTLAKFSRRTALIEEMAREKGIDNPDAKAELGAKTRNRKNKMTSFPDLAEEWRSRMSEQELEELRSLEHRMGGDAEPVDGDAAQRAIDYATLHAFERQSVIPERKHLTIALKRSVGEAKAEDVIEAGRKADLLRGVRQGRKMVSTREVYQEERKLITFAREGRGRCNSMCTGEIKFTRDWLSDEQKRAAQHILQSKDRLILLRGVAGVGKTTLMQEIAEQIERAGIKIHAFAPSADASRGVLRDSGFENAETVASLLVDPEKQEAIKDSLIWIDEAGLLGSKTLSQVIALAEKQNARVLLSGDRYQHASVERGSPLKLLETEAGIVPAEVKQIKRQSGQYREAVRLLAEQKTEEGYRLLDELGWVKQVDSENRYKVMAQDVVESIESGHSSLAISPTHIEGDRINCAIREQLKQKGIIGNEEREFMVLGPVSMTEAERSDRVNYAPDQVIVFHQNARGFKKGERVEVGDSSRVPCSQASRFQVYERARIGFAVGDRIRITKNGMTADHRHKLNNGAMYTIKSFSEQCDLVLKENDWVVAHDYGHLTHGYVVTSHAAQGKSVERVFIGQSSESFPASSKEQFYVSVSRGEKKAVIYTDDKDALREAITESDDRISATELMAAHRFEQSRNRDRDRGVTKEAMVYDR